MTDAHEWPAHSGPHIPRRHIDLYEELCQRMNTKHGPSAGPLEPFADWVEDVVVLDHIVNEEGMDEVRVVIHDCGDGDGYFWSTGGWYHRDHGFSTNLDQPTVGEWELETAWHFGGDGGPRMRIFWQNEDGLLEDDV